MIEFKSMKVINLNKLPQNVQDEFVDASQDHLKYPYDVEYVPWTVGISEEEVSEEEFVEFDDDSLTRNPVVCKWLRSQGLEIGETILLEVDNRE